MIDGVGCQVVMVFGQDVVPRSWRERSKRNGGCIPALQAIVENAPDVGAVLRLPAEIVYPSADDLLALELDGLRQGLHTRSNVDVEFVGQSVDLVFDGRLLPPEVGVGIRRVGRNRKLRGRAVFTGRSDAWRKRLAGHSP